MSAINLARIRDSEIHALLLYGTEGAGQEALALQMVELWLCERNGPLPCGECGGCQSFARGNHPDYLEVHPTGPSRLILLEQIVPKKDKKESPHHPVRAFVRTLALRGPRKVVWLHEVDRMNSDAANALLKMLEEPPPGLRFVLTTSRLNRVLPTVLSRCVARPVDLELSPTADLLERALPHLSGRLLTPEARPKLEAILADLPRASKGAALRLTESARELAEHVDRESARNGTAMVLEGLAYATAVVYPERTDWVTTMLEGHRLVLGNGSPTLTLDAVFANL